MQTTVRSPLFMVSKEPEIHRLVLRLDEARRTLDADPKANVRLQFARTELDSVREAFERSIRVGESALHELCARLSRRLFGGACNLESVVIGQSGPTGERFTLAQDIDIDTLARQTDLDLGRRLLSQLRFRQGDTWEQPRLVANYVAYQPTERNRFGIHKMISRIKAEEEIWNKVADELFGLDQLVARDKQLRELSRYVKDVFGIKFVLDDEAACRSFQQVLSDVVTSADGSPATWLETKDYLNPASKKRSGWSAVKSVAAFDNLTFEIQLQPLANYFREQEFLTKESHAGFKAKREQLRDDVAARLPLFAYFRDLLHALFDDEDAMPSHPRVSLEIAER